MKNKGEFGLLGMCVCVRVCGVSKYIGCKIAILKHELSNQFGKQASFSKHDRSIWNSILCLGLPTWNLRYKVTCLSASSDCSAVVRARQTGIGRLREPIHLHRHSRLSCAYQSQSHSAPGLMFTSNGGTGATRLVATSWLQVPSAHHCDKLAYSHFQLYLSRQWVLGGRWQVVRSILNDKFQLLTKALAEAEQVHHTMEKETWVTVILPAWLLCYLTLNTSQKLLHCFWYTVQLKMTTAYNIDRTYYKPMGNLIPVEDQLQTVIPNLETSAKLCNWF